MKLTDKLISEVGADKLLHLSLAGWMVSIAQDLGWAVMIIVTVLIIVLSAIKELWLDKSADWADMYAALLGMAISWTVYLIL